MNASNGLRIAALAGLALALTGCAAHTVAEAEATPYSVLELSLSLFHGSTYGYVDSEGQVQPLDDCSFPGLFDKRYCQSEDGSVRFSYYLTKNGITSTDVTVDGVVKHLDCTRDIVGNEAGGKYVCVPS
jgi:hypothetical protein